MRFHLILRKTLGDLSRVKLLVAYLVPFLVVLFFLALGAGENDFTAGIAQLPLAQQEAELFRSYAGLAYVWGAGLPLLIFGAVLGAITLAGEAERGTLRILLSKPVRRWEVLVGTAGGIAVYLLGVAAASSLLVAVLLFQFSDVTAAALSGGVFELLPALLAFGALVAAFVALVSVSLAVLTRNRIRTALLGLLVPTIYFVAIFVRAFAPDRYEDYYFYIADVNYHLGNSYVVVLDAFGHDVGDQLKQILAPWTGVYEVEQVEATGGGTRTTVESAGHVPEVASLLGLVGFALALFVVAAYRFEHTDL